MPTSVRVVWAIAALLLSTASGVLGWRLASRSLSQRLEARAGDIVARLGRTGARLSWSVAAVFAALAFVAFVGSAKVELIAGLVLLAVILVVAVVAVVAVARAAAGRDSIRR